MSTLQTHVDAFIAYVLTERGLSVNTAAAYRTDLEQFALAAMQRGARIAEDLLEAHAFAWIAQLRAAGIVEASVCRKTAALRQFARYLVIEGVRADEFTSGIAGQRRPRRLPRTLSLNRVNRLLEPGAAEGPSGLRDRAIAELLYASGLRVSELTGLTIDDLDMESGVVRCFGKGRKERMVPVGKTAITCVRAYLSARPSRAASRRVRHRSPDGAVNYLFPGRGGCRMSRQAVRAILRRMAVSAQLSDRISPHVLRHSFASHMLAGGADLRVIQELLGHAQVTTTEIYTHVTNDRLRDVYRRAHPRA